MKNGVRYIDQKVLKCIKDQYVATDSRIIFIDYDGTLIPFTKFPDQAVINKMAEGIITQLADDIRNKVVIISGRDRHFLQHQFPLDNITLIAEHGFFIKEPNKEWITNVSLGLEWKNKIAPVLKNFVTRCSGSFVEEKDASLAWHFRNAEDESIHFQINDLRHELQKILKDESKLEILEGKKVLEIKSILYDKGSAAAGLLASHHYLFTMAIGDDKTDEDLFKAMPENSFTIKVGNSFSLARFHLKKQEQLYQLFRELLN
jgi:trehalose 6-phosphate synthase/phosphatase